MLIAVLILLVKALTAEYKEDKRKNCFQMSDDSI